MYCFHTSASSVVAGPVCGVGGKSVLRSDMGEKFTFRDLWSPPGGLFVPPASAPSATQSPSRGHSSGSTSTPLWLLSVLAAGSS